MGIAGMHAGGALAADAVGVPGTGRAEADPALAVA